MKYIVILGDGMADLPIKSRGMKTPLELAIKSNIDELAKVSELGLVRTIPDGMPAGSDVANLSVMGYDPQKYYTGRAPIEAVSMGLKLNPADLAVRCNLVTLSDDAIYEDKIMVDYSAGEITTEEASELIKAVNDALGDERISFSAGVSYRHCMVVKDTQAGTTMTPPHDISDKPIFDYLPTGHNGKLFLELMKKSYDILKDHPINLKRIENDLPPANSIWLWGEGSPLEIPAFYDLHKKHGAVISAVDLIKGIGLSAGMDIYEVDGATGGLDTNYSGKALAAVEALKRGADYVYLHIEAPDECGHRGELDNKIQAIENIDLLVVKRIKDELDASGEPYRLLLMPDHSTPISTKTHNSEPVPYLLYDSANPLESENTMYSEKTAKNTEVFFESGKDFLEHFLNGTPAMPKMNNAETAHKPSEVWNEYKERLPEERVQNNEKRRKDKLETEIKVKDKKDSGAKKIKKSGGKFLAGDTPEKTKRNRIIFAVCASVLVVAIVLAIIIPILIANAGKIFVSTAEDFKKTEGNCYVLKNDITVNGNLDLPANLSIDLAGKTLTVNGDFLLKTKTTDQDVNIGTLKKKVWEQGGMIVVNGTFSIDISTPVVLHSKVNANIVLGENSMLRVHNEITKSVSGKSDAENVGVAIFYKNSTCPDVRNLKEVEKYVSANVTVDISKCDRFTQVEKLSTPSMLQVVKNGNDYFLIVGEVKNSNGYGLMIDGTTLEFPSDNNITNYITKAGKHTIAVFAKGYRPNYEEEQTRKIYYAYDDSDQISITYNFVVQLKTPVPIFNYNDKTLTIENQDENTKNYVITLYRDGENLGEKSVFEEFDISTPGNYFVTVKATATDKNSYADSELGATSFTVNGALPEITNQNEEYKDGKLHIIWSTETEWFGAYKVTVTTEDGSQKDIVIITNLTECSITCADKEYDVNVKLLKNGIYE